ncbi:MAG: hypothetical protein IT370_02105 [Deltaproteobacteria bacterium]|nr:hypothetical protein [Deltaproteobacteria bacterium]
MASIEIAPLSDRLTDEEIEELGGALAAASAPKLPKGDDGVKKVLSAGLDEDTLTEFMDRLEAHEIACDIYLPIEFEGRVEVGDLRAGSVVTLMETLAELKDDFNLETDDDEDEDEEDDGDDDEEDEDDDDEEDDDDDDDDSVAALIERRLQALWKVFSAGAKRALERKIPLHVRM